MPRPQSVYELILTFNYLILIYPRLYFPLRNMTENFIVLGAEHGESAIIDIANHTEEASALAQGDNIGDMILEELSSRKYF